MPRTTSSCLDGAADVNVVGEENKPTLALNPSPLDATRLSGAADTPLMPIRAGSLQLVFLATHKRPGTLPKRAIQMMKSHRSWTVAMVTSHHATTAPPLNGRSDDAFTPLQGPHRDMRHLPSKSARKATDPDSRVPAADAAELLGIDDVRVCQLLPQVCSDVLRL